MQGHSVATWSRYLSETSCPKIGTKLSPAPTTRFLLVDCSEYVYAFPLYQQFDFASQSLSLLLAERNVFCSYILTADMASPKPTALARYMRAQVRDFYDILLSSDAIKNSTELYAEVKVQASQSLNDEVYL